jgi:GTP-binding protein HflX
LGGGIGTRGPGETKLETDRRHIRSRITSLENELREMEKHRKFIGSRRKRDGVLTVAIVGYTNAGKSTLLNTLTDAGILAEDQLFATLDPTTRDLTLPDGEHILLTDTVGFIRKLPHNLIEAFKSTLEEAKYADLILHVVDASNPDMDVQMHVVYETLKSLGIHDKEIITLFNKVDRPDVPEVLKDFQADRTIRISALTGVGLIELQEALADFLRSRNIWLEQVYPYSQAGKIAILRKKGQLMSEEYTEEGIRVTGYIPAEYYESVRV